VKQLNGKQAADEAQEHFVKVFQKGETPEEIPKYTFTASYAQDELFHIDIAPTLLRNGLVKSNSALRRLLTQGAIELDGKKVSSNAINARNGSVLRIGKHSFVRIAIK
jgi:tyrosyl-tRNA synthetase